MGEDQECNTCGGGDCDPLTHKFPPEQLNEPQDQSTLQDVRKALLEVCAASNIAIDQDPGNGERPFIDGAGSSGEPTTQHLLEAIKKSLEAPKSDQDESSEESKSESDEVEVEEQQVGEKRKRKNKKKKKKPVSVSSNSSPTMKDMMKMFMKSQMVAGERQDKMMEGMLSLAKTNATKQSSTIVDLTSTVQNQILPTKPKVTLVKVANPEDAAWAEVTLKPLYQVEGDPCNLDLSQMKRKLQGGEENTNHLGVLHEVRWVHMYVASSLCPGGVQKHSLLTVNQYFSGMSNLILMESDPANPDYPVIRNKMRHMSKIASLSLSRDWADCLELDATVFRNLEQAQLEWSDWPALQRLYSNTLEFLNTRSFASQSHHHNKRQRSEDDQIPPTSKPTKDRIEGIQISFMRENVICIKFQSGRCPQNTDHVIVAKDLTVRHICAGCLWLKLPVDSSHGAKTCPNRSKFFRM